MKFIIKTSLTIFLLLPFIVFAQTTSSNTSKALTSVKNPLTSRGGVIPLDDITNRGIKMLIGAIAFISLIMFIWGGFSYMTADGKSNKTEDATNIMLWSALGIAVSIFAYMIINTIFKYIVF